MQKEFRFGKHTTMTVKDEKLSGILLDVDALKVDGETIAPIKNLNEIGIDISVKRKGDDKEFIHQGYLDDLLIGLYAQTPSLQIAKKPLLSGYKMLIDFSGVLELNVGDEFEVSMNPSKEAFDGLSTVNSSITVETIPTTQDATFGLPKIITQNVGAGNSNIDEQFDENMLKLVLVTDYKKPYDQSTNSKIETFNLRGNVFDEQTDEDIPFDKTVSHNALIAQNMNMLDVNPESDVQNLVLYLSDNHLDKAHLRAKLDKPANEDAKLISVHYDLI